MTAESVQLAPARKAAYAKLHQKASHYAIVGVAAALDVEGGVCRSARIAVTGASTHAQRLPTVEAAVAGGPLTPERIAAATANADRDLADVNSDLHGSEEYRRAMVRVFARRAIERAAARQ